MTTTRRLRRRRRYTEADELRGWSELFDCGYDFFDDVEFIAGRTFPDDDRFETAKYAAAREAWARLGARFMATWRPSDVRELPWALEQYGPPPGWPPAQVPSR